MSQAESLRERVWRSRWQGLREPLETLAAERGLRVFLIGGYVRDLLLERSPRDLDLTVEGDGLEFAEALARRLGGEVRKAERFLTSEVELPDGRHIDVASTRSETYTRPGELPRVRPAGLETDLGRRDFSVNTFALCVAGDAGEELRSVAGAREDLAARVLRPLHSRSFLDDPTRILRAVAQEVRLGFRLTDDGEEKVRHALAAGALGTVSSERLWSELEPLLTRSTGQVSSALRRLASLGALDALLPGLDWLPVQERYLERGLGELEAYGETVAQGAVRGVETVGSVRDRRTQLALLALASGRDAYVGRALADRLRLPRIHRSVLESWARQGQRAVSVIGEREARPSAVHGVLQELSSAELFFLAAVTDECGRAWVRRELREMRRLDLRVRPADLLERGATPGPEIGRALKRTLAARLDDRIGPEEELDYALEVLRLHDASEIR